MKEPYISKYIRTIPLENTKKDLSTEILKILLQTV